MHRCRESIVGGLRFVDVIVWVQCLVFIGKLSAIEYMSPVGHYFINVHIALGAAACLPYHQREPFVQLAVEDFLANSGNQVQLFFRKNPGFKVGDGGRMLEVGKGLNDLFRHPVNILGDAEVFNAALGLGAIISVHGHLYFAHRVFFNPVF
jgi:hypothetical protein